MTLIPVQFSPVLASDLFEHVLSQPLHLGPLTFSNHVLMMVVSATLMLVVFSVMGQQARKPVPTGLRNFFEAILSYLRTEVFRPALGVHTDRFVPFLWTVFFFILFCNVLGMIPTGAILGLMDRDWEHLGGTPTGNLAVTGGLALVAFAMIHVAGIVQQIRIAMDPSLDPHHHVSPHPSLQGGGQSDHGGGHVTGQVGAPAAESEHVGGMNLLVAVPVGIAKYTWNYAPHPQVSVGPVNLLFWLFLMVLEVIGGLVKPFALGMRLFANMLAGHLLLAALVALIPVGAGLVAMKFGVGFAVVAGCTALSLLELFVAFLQAYIFTFLTTLFIASAVSPEH